VTLLDLTALCVTEFCCAHVVLCSAACNANRIINFSDARRERGAVAAARALLALSRAEAIGSAP
jgi:hypothetical protein